MKSLLIYLLSFFQAVVLFGQGLGLPFSRYYASQEYGGGIQNYAITQNPTGIIYIANNYGLLEYDGTSWRRYALPSGSKVRHVQLGEDGLIYVAGQGDFGFFGPDSSGEFAFQSLRGELPEAYRELEEVWRVYLLADALYFCTDRHIFVFDKNRQFQQVFSSKSSFESFHFNGNRLYINEVGQGLQVVQGGEPTPIGGARFFQDQLVTSVLQLSPSVLLVFTRDQGVYHVQGETITPWRQADGTGVNTALRLRNGQVILGTQTDGLYMLDEQGQQLLHLDTNNGLTNNAILSLFEDLSGNLWIGHANGLTLLELVNPFRKINQFSGLTGTGYHATLFDGSLYLGTNNGVYVLGDTEADGEDAVFLPNSQGQVYQLKAIQDQLLIAHNDGAFVVDNGIAKRVDGPSGIWNFQPLRGHSNLLLVGGYNGIYLYEIDPAGIRYLRKISGFTESSRIIEQDAQGNIWVAHGYKGLYKLQLDNKLQSVSVEVYGQEAGLPSKTMNNVWYVNNRLVFTTQSGIFRFDEQRGRFERDEFFQKFFGNGDLLHVLLEDPLGNIYFIGAQEVGVLEKRVDGRFVKRTELFNQLRPLLNDDLQNISAIRGNEVLFAANEGFVRFSLNEGNYRPHDYPTLIRSVHLTGAVDSLIFAGGTANTVSGGEKWRPNIPYSRANLRITASNPTPNNEKELAFQYWLEGLEEGYGEWTQSNEKAYTNLSEGKYTFRARSRNLYGQIAAEAIWSFEVLPPWYRSRLAYGAYFLLVCLVGLLGYRTVDRRFQQKTQQMKDASMRVIQEKESELLSSQKELESLRTEKLKQEIQLKDKELATATMHLITKNGFIDQVKGNLSGIIKKSKNQEVKNEIQKVIKNIEKNIAEDEDWEQFEIHFDQVHGDFMSRFKKSFSDLSPQEIKLSAYLRMNLSTKEIAYLMNISVRGVEIARYRLRKKLDLQREDNLQEYILKF
ncbi:ligand-binding sensor domain-containing protein [Lunatimonas salinarum]|uniref:ligand-binding sensor domain-containing protein n=1 Tax=Lunatimonas salinarum TaxID=1774590 RepID=UPI001FD8192E|nr:triple tyrosine motif-containing protein [Lunatimonas salinarum]